VTAPSFYSPLPLLKEGGKGIDCSVWRRVEGKAKKEKDKKTNRNNALPHCLYWRKSMKIRENTR
jgi:hypothetical protein